jgi:hypothetical protein
MKTSSLKLSFIAALLTVAIPAFAHPDGHAPEAPEHDKPAKPNSTAEKLPETVAEILKTIDAQQALLRTALDEGKLSVVQANALTVNTLVQHLVTKVPADHVASVKELAARHAQITKDIVKSSSAGAKKETEANASKLSSNIRALKTEAH